jgi:hypothetical protein
MKTMKSFFILIILLFAFGCERNSKTRNSEIRVGDYNNMLVNFYDTILDGGYSSPDTFNLDLDNNNIADIQFISEVWGSAGMGHHPKSAIKCLNNNVELFGYFTSDTLFLNRSTQLSEGTNNTFFKHQYFKYTCQKIDTIDSIVKIAQNFKVIAINRKDALNHFNVFNSDTCILKDDNYTLPFWLYNDGDTVIYKFEEYYNNCNNFPLDNINYIGLKLDNERLGWVKISIFDQNIMMIYESAIQE